MSPKEKAEKLCYEMCLELPTRNGYLYAKQCALIAVDEMINQMLSLMKVFNEDRSEFEAIELDYLTKVKKEIEKL